MGTKKSSTLLAPFGSTELQRKSSKKVDAPAEESVDLSPTPSPTPSPIIEFSESSLQKPTKKKAVTKKVIETPVIETPVIETPVIETPVIETSVIETPVIETPVIETPVLETNTTVVPKPVKKKAPSKKVTEVTVVEAHVVEAHVVEAHVVESPVLETPILETPILETNTTVAPKPVKKKTPSKKVTEDSCLRTCLVVEATVVESPVIESPVVESQVVEASPAPKPVKKKAPSKKPASKSSPLAVSETGLSPMREISIMDVDSEGMKEEEIPEKSETLILHLPIKSTEVHNNSHPKGIHHQKAPVATYSLDGNFTLTGPPVSLPPLSQLPQLSYDAGVEAEADSNPDYQDILKDTSNLIERKESVIFAESTHNDRDVSKMDEEFDKRVKDFKEFKLNHFITTIPKNHQPSPSSLDDDEDDDDEEVMLTHSTPILLASKGLGLEGTSLKSAASAAADSFQNDLYNPMGDHGGTLLNELDEGAPSTVKTGSTAITKKTGLGMFAAAAGSVGGGGGAGTQGNVFADFSSQEETSHIYAHDHKGNRMIKKNLKNIMVEFMNANLYQEWPDQTNIHCWWCCHQFEGPPCCLPEYVRRGKFYVAGCFCNFNCAAAYNFNRNDNNVWERYSLLNLMYKKLFNTNFVKIDMAPPREVLKMFGGYMEIDEFRAHCLKQEKTFQVVRPPLVSIIPKIEEHINPKNRVVNEHILNSTQSKLKLTRSKPLISDKSSIQTYMNITFKKEDPSGGGGGGEGDASGPSSSAI